MFNNIFKTFISTIAFLILCISIYLAILVSFDFFDQDNDMLTRAPMDPHMDMMKRPIDIREMTADDYDLLIKQLELEKQFIEQNINLEKNRIDLEIQRLITEKNK